MTIDAGAMMLRAARHFESAANLAAAAEVLPLPDLFMRARAINRIQNAYRAATSEAMRGVHVLESLGAPVDDARTGVRTALDQIDPKIQYRIEYMREQMAAKDVPGLLRMHADQLRLRVELDPLDPAAARRRVQAELDEILRVPDSELTQQQRWRVGMMHGLPPHQRPDMPEPLRASHPLDLLAARGSSPATDDMAWGEWATLRLDLRRRELAAEPGVSREALDAELRATIARTDSDVPREMSERLTVIAGLDDDLRPAILDTPLPSPQHGLSHLSVSDLMQDMNVDAKAKYDSLRMAVEHERMLADPTLTREVVTSELRELLSVPNELLTMEQLRRMSVLARLPEHVRPVMPATLGWHYRFEDLGLHGYHPAKNRRTAKVLDLMRAHTAAVFDPERAAGQLKARLDAGEQIDIRMIAALSMHKGLLDRAGLTKDVLHRQALRALAGAGAGSSQTLPHHLAIVRDTLAAVKADDHGIAAMRAEALELAERNLDRMAGRRSDTFARHPDYGEIGRFVSIADLLDALGPATAGKSSGRAAAADTTAEQLPW